MPESQVRPARPEDAEAIVRLVRGLAVYEKADPEQVKLTPADVVRDGFGPERKFEMLVAEHAGRVVDLALFFPAYSSWEACPQIFLEDLFVEADARGLGLGRKLFAALARLGLERGCARLEFYVSEGNPTRDFYHRIGASRVERTLPYRMGREEMLMLAAQDNSQTMIA